MRTTGTPDRWCRSVRNCRSQPVRQCTRVWIESRPTRWICCRPVSTAGGGRGVRGPSPQGSRASWGGEGGAGAGVGGVGGQKGRAAQQPPPPPRRGGGDPLQAVLDAGEVGLRRV